MSKRPVEERGDSPPTKRRSSSPDSPIQNLLQSLGSEDARTRSVSIAGLSGTQPDGAGEVELVRDALEYQLWIEQDPFLVQQLVKVLAPKSGRQSSSNASVVLQKYYISDACSSDSSRICVLSSLNRLCECSELLKPAESRMLQDVERENPMLRLFVLKFFVNHYQREQRNDYLVSEILSKKFFDVHEVVRVFALEAAVSLEKLGQKSLELFHSAGFRLLQDASESIRISGMKLLRLWVTETHALEERANENKINHCYLLMCTMITDSSMNVRKEVCHLLGAMNFASSKVKLHSINKKSTQLTKDDPTLSNGGEAPVAMAAGAFVSAVEDEFPEVRSAAIQSLTILSLHCTELVSSVLALLLDLLNDQNVVVRMEAIRALCRLAEKGLLCLQQKQLLVICDVLKDCPEVRNIGRKLLSSMRFPTLSEFSFVVQCLLSSLEQHLEDKEDIFESLLSFGDRHAAHVEALISDFAKQLKLLRRREKGLDDPKVMALVNLCRGSLRSESFIFPEFLPAAFERKPSSLVCSDGKPELMLVIQRSLLVHPHSEGALTILSACRKALAVLETSPQVNLGILYLESLTLVAKLKLKLAESDDQCQKLLTTLSSMQVRFSGFTDTGSLQVLELKLFGILKQSSRGQDDIFSQLSAIVEDSKRYSSGEDFPLLKVAGEQLESSFTGLDRLKALGEAAESFWPKHDIYSSDVQEMRGSLRVPASDFEHRLKFISGFPYQLKISGELKQITSGSRLWIEMGFEYCPCQYSSLRNTGEFNMEFTDEVIYYNMPLVSSGSLRVRIVAEVQEPGTRVSGHRGPQASLVPVSDEQVVYLQADNV